MGSCNGTCIHGEGERVLLLLFIITMLSFINVVDYCRRLVVFTGQRGTTKAVIAIAVVEQVVTRRVFASLLLL